MATAIAIRRAATKNKIAFNTLKNMVRNDRPLNPRQKRQVKAAVRGIQELKYFISNQVDGGTVSDTLGINDISAVPQGDTDVSRDGDRLQWVGRISINFNVVGAVGATGDLYNTFRLIVLQWKPNSTPTVSDILLTGPTAAVDVYSQYNHDNRQQYTILLDKMFTVNGNNTTLVPASIPNSPYSISKHFEVNIKKAAKMAQFSGGSTSGTNKFYYILGSDSSAVTHPTYSWSSKIFFRDS